MKHRGFIPTDYLENRLIRNLRRAKGSQLVARNSEARSLLLDQAVTWLWHFGLRPPFGPIGPLLAILVYRPAVWPSAAVWALRPVKRNNIRNNNVLRFTTLLHYYFILELFGQ